MRPPPFPYVAGFDSASVMLQALARHLDGRDFPAIGQSRWREPLAEAVNLLPRPVRELVYARSGAAEAVYQRNVEGFTEEGLDRWAVGHYAERTYPAVAIGASNGALLHLWAALGVPWLPQTVLMGVRQGKLDPDDFKSAMAAGAEPGQKVLARSPNLQLHQMHDPSQDRLMARHMMYFRFKKRALGPAYRRFLDDRLEPGGTIFITDCRLSWPTTRVGPRHVFQSGGSGGVSAEEVLGGSRRIADWLTGQGAGRKSWDAPAPDERSPEAEWGLEPALADEVEDYARARGHCVVRAIFEEPEDPSPLVADLYRWWYRRRGIPADRLLVESFIMLEPWWTLRLGLAPFWMKFNTDSSLAAIERYLDAAPPCDDVFLTLFAHGVDSLGVPPIHEWQRVIERGRREGRFLGVDKSAFPADFAVFARFYKDLRALPGMRWPMEQLPLDLLWRFLDEHAARYAVRWEERTGAPRGHRSRA